MKNLMICYFCLIGLSQMVFAAIVEWPASSGGNGHFYEAVYTPGGISWTDANNSSARTGGYLVSITSPAENNFVHSLITDPVYWDGPCGPWIGGFQPTGSPEPSGGWQWVTGEPFVYNNWNDRQPNEFNGNDESCIHFGWNEGTPYWNDVPDKKNAFNARYVQGYIIEYNNDPSVPNTHYVDIDNTTPSHPHTSWATAATNIQSAIDAANTYDTVLVNDGFYDSGEVPDPVWTPPSINRIVITKDIIVESVNGAKHTFIVGHAGEGPMDDGAVRGVYMSAGLLSGFTITNGYSGSASFGISNGGGVHMVGNSVVSHCILVGNSSESYGGGSYNGTLINCVLKENSAFGGGGSHWGTLINCILTANSAFMEGGGMNYGTAYNCTIISNQIVSPTGWGGGMAGGSAYNCILWNNFAGADNDTAGTICEYSCSADLIHGINGNITNSPVITGNGNYHLATNSPCINAGSNGTVGHASDLGGHPRIADGTVDMGAYEFGFDSRFITRCVSDGAETILEWTAFPGWESTVMSSTNLQTMPFTALSAPLPYPVNSYTDAVSKGKCFYKVELEP